MDADLEKLRRELTQLEARQAAALIVAQKAVARAAELQARADELSGKADELRRRLQRESSSSAYEESGEKANDGKGAIH